MVRGKPKTRSVVTHYGSVKWWGPYGPPVHIFVLNNIFVAFVNDICLNCRTVYLFEWTPPGDITCSLQNPGSEFQFLPTWYTENGWYYRVYNDEPYQCSSACKEVIDYEVNIWITTHVSTQKSSVYDETDRNPEMKYDQYIYTKLLWNH